MQMERDGCGFCLSAARSLHGAAGRHAFQNHADDEEQHFSVLMMRYDLGFGPAEWSA